MEVKTGLKGPLSLTEDVPLIGICGVLFLVLKLEIISYQIRFTNGSKALQHITFCWKGMILTLPPISNILERRSFQTFHGHRDKDLHHVKTRLILVDKT